MSINTTWKGASPFASTELRSAVQALEPTLLSYKSTIDALCADIVAVERLLQERHVLIDISMGTGLSPATDYNGREGQFFKLRWGEDKFRNFRLLYSTEREHPSGDYDEILESRPLAEAPLYLRVALSAQLPRFLKEVDCELKRWEKAYRESVGRPSQPNEEKIHF